MTISLIILKWNTGFVTRELLIFPPRHGGGRGNDMGCWVEGRRGFKCLRNFLLKKTATNRRRGCAISSWPWIERGVRWARETFTKVPVLYEISNWLENFGKLQIYWGWEVLQKCISFQISKSGLQFVQHPFQVQTKLHILTSTFIDKVFSKLSYLNNLSG